MGKFPTRCCLSGLTLLRMTRTATLAHNRSNLRTVAIGFQEKTSREAFPASNQKQLLYSRLG